MSDEMDLHLATSIRDRLQNHAKARGENFETILYRYAIERFLYRLSCSPYRERFVLKGAQVFTAWGVPLGRPTRDIDLRGYTSNSVDRLVQIFREICTQEVELDGMVFELQDIGGFETQDDADYAGVRIRFGGRLGSARVRMQVDIGFTDKITPAALALDYPSLLTMPAPTLLSYPPETVIAEKLQALVYLGEINSRMKDFYDLWLLSERFDFEGVSLQKAIEVTFRTRQTPLPSGIPSGLTDEFAAQKQGLWQRGFLGKFQREPEVWMDFQEIVKRLRAFLIPLLSASTKGKAFERFWKAGEAWYEG